MAWLWVNEHDWPGWRIEVLRVFHDVAGFAPVPAEREVPHPWQPPSPRRLLTVGVTAS